MCCQEITNNQGLNSYSRLEDMKKDPATRFGLSRFASHLRLAVLAVCLLGLSTCNRQQPELLSLAGNTDSVDLETFLEGERQLGNRCCQHSVTIVPSSAYPDAPAPRTGDQFLRLELRYDDPEAPFTSKRAEITFSDIAKGLGRISGPSEWYGFSVFLPASHEPDEAAEIIAQWHATPDRDQGEVFRSPVLSLHSRNGYWQLISRHSAEKIQATNDVPGMRLWQAAYQKGIWTDFIFHTRWDWRPAGEGFIDVWMKQADEPDWQQVMEYQGPTAYRDDGPVYFKAGIYKWPWEDCAAGDPVEACSGGGGAPRPSNVERRVVYLDNIRAVSGDDVVFDQIAPVD